MKRTAIATAAALAFAATAAFADQGFDDYARVTNVDPQYERVNVPRKECYTEYEPQTYQREHRSLVGPLIGGVAGGLLGAQVGRGSGRVAASAIGAGVGAIVGDRLGNRDRGGAVEYTEREVRRCRLVDNWETRISAYRVAYEYAGRTYTTVLPYDPGSRLAVRVDVEPVGDGR